ncbi:flavin monoamine oxidase family protein [Herbidospora mongoliensis]|uniref:flavin monoamine oxidase family protein n=1 Tax=Herbidospora mongoliensis TaxID=688067 RepID=UPI00083093F2|nr:FAD-dependent oxidoreductase [Herbidospora mongoliensis]
MTGELTRRALLHGLGAAGGAGAMLAAMGALGLVPGSQSHAFRAPQPGDFSLTGRSPKRVVVLGAGIAGLATAYELRKAGYDVTILEAAKKVGGRNLTLRGGDEITEIGGVTQEAGFRDGTYFNAGPARIAQWMITMDYCRELGVPLEIFVNSNADAYVHTGGKSVRYRTARADTYGYLGELLAKATNQGALDADLTAADKTNLLDLLREFGQLGEQFTYEGGERRANTGPIPSVSEVLGYRIPQALFWDLAHDQAMPMFQPVGGMDRIVDALAANVGRHRIKTNTPATRITDNGREVVVEYKNGSIKADFCVATLPPHVLARIPGSLPPEVVQSLGSGFNFSGSKLGLEYGRRWWELDEDIYGGTTETDLDIRTIWYPSHGFHERRGLLVGYYHLLDQADSYDALAPAARLERALKEGEKVHGPRYRKDLLSSISMSWRKRPHIEGMFTAGLQGGLLEQAHGRVYLAGDWLTDLVAWQAGAFESARKAVLLIHERALKEN